MSHLTPDDQALLERARRSGGATAADHARIKRKLFTRIGIGIGASTMATSGASAGALAGGTAAGTGLLATAKVVVALALGAGAATGAFAGYRSRSEHESHRLPAATAIAAVEPAAPRIAEPSPPAQDLPSKTLPAELQAPVSRAVAEPHALKTSVPKATPMPPPPTRPTPTTAPAATPMMAPAATPMTAPITSPIPTQSPPLSAPVAPASPPELPAAPATVGAEADLLREADGAMKAGHAPRALALLQEHATRFPNGVLIEEREAERIVVLCALGRTEDARAAASRFLRERPRSPLVRRVYESCGGG